MYGHARKQIIMNNNNIFILQYSFLLYELYFKSIIINSDPAIVQHMFTTFIKVGFEQVPLP